MNDSREIARAAADGSFEHAVLITLVGVDGSSYRKRGARMLITDQGESFGAVSGGCLDAALRQHALRVMAEGRAQLLDLDTTADTDVLFGHGLGCPARLRFAFEPFRSSEPLPVFARIEAAASKRTPQLLTIAIGGETVFEESLQPPLRLIAVGAGNDAQPLVRFGRALGWECVVVDTRERFASAERFPDADRIIHARPEEVLAHVVPDSRTAVLLLTHHYLLDLEYLRAFSGSAACYLGVIGSRVRFESMLSELEGEGAAVDRERIFGPVGLDIGSETPAEIALAAVAEIKAVVEGRRGGSLRDRARQAAPVGA
jgi:xanthine dehydrogenase accessory factor